LTPVGYRQVPTPGIRFLLRKCREGCRGRSGSVGFLVAHAMRRPCTRPRPPQTSARRPGTGSGRPTSAAIRSRSDPGWPSPITPITGRRCSLVLRGLLGRRRGCPSAPRRLRDRVPCPERWDTATLSRQKKSARALQAVSRGGRGAGRILPRTPGRPRPRNSSRFSRSQRCRARILWNRHRAALAIIGEDDVVTAPDNARARPTPTRSRDQIRRSTGAAVQIDEAPVQHRFHAAAGWRCTPVLSDRESPPGSGAAC